MGITPNASLRIKGINNAYQRRCPKCIQRSIQRKLTIVIPLVLQNLLGWKYMVGKWIKAEFFSLIAIPFIMEHTNALRLLQVNALSTNMYLTL
mgnify:FL=1